MLLPARAQPPDKLIGALLAATLATTPASAEGLDASLVQEPPLAAAPVPPEADAQSGADALIAAALAARAHDNVTAVVVRLADLTPVPAGGRP